MNFYVIIASKKFEVVVWNIDQSEVTFESVETKSVLRQLTFPANVQLRFGNAFTTDMMQEVWLCV